MTDPTFSIVSPVRNALPQLRRCVGSVRGQRGVTKEHLVQDAISTDGSNLWLGAQADLSVVSEADAGMYDAINRGWRRSRGRILSWLNADEQYLPGTLSAVERIFDSNPQADIIFGDVLLVHPSGALIAARREIPLRRRYVESTFLYALSCGTFFRRLLLERGELEFDPQRRFAGDAEVVLSLLKKGRKALHVAQYFSLFGIDGGNLSMDSAARAESQEVSAGTKRVTAPFVSAARRLEKAVCGCYRRVPVSYAWAENEIPTYKHFSYDRAPTRFEWVDLGAPMARPKS